MLIRLSVMMFLEFFIWGGWFVTLGTFLANNLNATDPQIAKAFSTQSWGAIIAPFIFGLVADRYFNAERMLGIIHLIGAVLLFQMGNSSDFTIFYPFVLAYFIIYMPTLALVNSVTFRQMEDPASDFSKVRVWGTLGWIISGLLISFVFSWDSSLSIGQGTLKNTFLMCSIASLILGLYSFTLPKTPPSAIGGENKTLKEVLGLDALKLLNDRNYALFFISSILICIPLAFYYQNTNPFLTEIGVANQTGKMTIGQISEVLFMLLLPIFLKRYGIKKTLLFGMMAWGIRYGLFAYGNAGSSAWMLLIGIALHGVCYDFFFVSGQIYTDSKAGAQYKSSAQGLITLATYGLGMLVGFWTAGQISEFYAISTGHDWNMIWIMPGVFSLLVFVFFFFAFKNEKFWWGITSHFGDLLMGTFPDAKTIAKSDTAGDIAHIG